MKKLLFNSTGMGLIEAMMAAGMLAIITAGVYKGVDMWTQILSTEKSTSISDGIKTEIIQSFASQAQFMQIDYSTRSASQILSGRLPMAWNKFGKKVPVSICEINKECPRGRYGVVVKAVTGHKGIYKMTIKITHDDWSDPKIAHLLIGE